MLVAAAAAPLTFGTPCPAPNVTKIDFVEAHSLTLVNSHFDADPVKRFPYHRLPAAAEGVVRSSIWDLSLQTAGFAVAFETDAGGPLHLRRVQPDPRVARHGAYARDRRVGR